MACMKHKCFLFVTILLLIVIPAQAQDVVSDLLGRINALRAEQGLPAYSLNAALNNAALSQAQWMANTNSVTHYRPDGNGPRDRALAAGYSTNWVSENIYMGTNATSDSAWNFWINSSVHYAGLTSLYYRDIGIATASGEGGHAFVLVFGNPSGSIPAAPLNNNSSNTDTNDNSSAPVVPATEPPPPPSFVVGLDTHGNIKHEVQPGDTVGDIAFIYGYTWDDIPYMLEINSMSEEDAEALEISSIFLVPPYDGTYTPTSAPETEIAASAPTHTPTPASLSAPVTYVAPTATSIQVSTQISVAQPLPTTTPAMVVAALPTDNLPPIVAGASNTWGRPPWLIAAVLVQVGVLLAASVEFVRRSRK